MTSRVIETKSDLGRDFFDVPGYESYLEITRTGVIRSKPRRVNSPAAGGSRMIKGKLLAVHTVRGYPAITLLIARRKKTLYIHRMLALLFIPNPHGKPCINHIDGNRANNKLDNLEWCTHAENMRHAFRTGLTPLPKTGRGEDSPSAKLTDEKVRDIKRRLQLGETQKSLAAEYSVSKGAIGWIARGQTWSHISP